MSNLPSHARAVVIGCGIVGNSVAYHLGRLIEERFVYRPATDRSGRPVPDDVEIDWTWD